MGGPDRVGVQPVADVHGVGRRSTSKRATRGEDAASGFATPSSPLAMTCSNRPSRPTPSIFAIWKSGSRW